MLRVLNRYEVFLSTLTLSNGTTQARIAEEAGACAVMALERVPADIRKEGGVSRMVSCLFSHILLLETERKTFDRV